MASVSTATTHVRFRRIQFSTSQPITVPASSYRPRVCKHLTLTLAQALAELVWTPAASAVLIDTTVPAARVVPLVRAGRLWISSGGRAIELVVHVDAGYEKLDKIGRKKRKNRLPLPAKLLNRLADAIAGWDVWAAELGVRVRRQERDENPDGHDGVLRFLLTQTALAGGLCGPPKPTVTEDDPIGSPATGTGIPQAQLQRVVCRLEYGVVSSGTFLAAQPVGRGKNKPTMARRYKHRPRPRSSSKTWSSNGQQRPLPIDGASILRSSLNRAKSTTVLWPAAISLAKATMMTLVGVRHHISSVRRFHAKGQWMNEDNEATRHIVPCLLDIAPAACNAHYAQGISERAAFVPMICRLLASAGGNTQAPTFLQKVDSMCGDGPRGVAAANKEGAAYRTRLIAPQIETRLHEILLKGLSPFMGPAKHPQRRANQLHQAKAPTLIATTPAKPQPIRVKKGLRRASKAATAARNSKTTNNSVRNNDQSNNNLVTDNAPQISPFAETDGDIFYDLCLDDLDVLLAFSGDERDRGAEAGDREQGTDEESYWKEVGAWSEIDWCLEDNDDAHDDDKEADWKEVETWSEIDWCLEDNDEDSASSTGWSPLTTLSLYDDAWQEEINGCHTDVADVDSMVWQDVEDWQLEACLGDKLSDELQQDAQKMCWIDFHDNYGIIGGLEEMDVDRQVYSNASYTAWHNEQHMMEACY